MSNPLFFVCANCKKPGYEEPSYKGNLIVHEKCSEFVSQKQELMRQIEEKYDPTKIQAKIYFEKDLIVIDHPFNVKLNSAYLKFFAFKTWNPTTKRREIKKSKINSINGNFLLREIQFIGPEYNWVKNEDVCEFLNLKAPAESDRQDKIKQLNEIKKNFEADTDVSHMKIPLMGYQKAGVAFLEHADGIALIGDEMGCGKSAQALAYTSKYKQKTIIVTLASIKFNWKNEVQKFTNSSAIVIHDKSTIEELKQYDYVITNYDQLRKWEPVLKKMKFDTIILDESHSIANGASLRSKLVSKLFKKIKHRILLSGTPTRNKPMELFYQLKFLQPSEFSNKQDFGFRYCGPTTGYNDHWEFKGSSNLDELNERISGVYIRRLKSEVLKDLPPKRISNLIYQMDKDDRKAYDLLVEEISKNQETKQSILSQSQTAQSNGLMSLMKFCSNHKVPYLIEFVKQMIQEDLSSNKKIVVFAHFKETQKLLQKAFPGISTVLFAEMTAEQRQESVDKFNNDPNMRIFIGSTLAAGTGINLTSADTVVFADILWTPAIMKQSEDRVHRHGQQNNTFIYYMTFEDTVEQAIWSTIEKKLLVTAQTHGDIPYDENAVVTSLAKIVFVKKPKS
jgi:SNF2 family DNA or RNA helicase